MARHSSQQDLQIAVITSEDLHRNRSNISVGGVSIVQLSYLSEREAVGNPSKEFTKFPEDKDLLSRFQVACIIVNRMIGTGIFESPTTIIQQDRNIGGSLILWSLGFIASMAGTLMYVEYGLTIPRRKMAGAVQAVPRSGGELNYLKFLAKRPKYMAICTFGFIFILVGNSAANCVSFGVHVLAAAGINDPRKGTVQGIALGAAWLVSLLHALGRMFGVHLNSAFAVTKVSMLLMIIILGFMVLNNHTEHLHRDPLSYTNLNRKTSFKELGTGDHAGGFAASYLNIIFTCGGWNQANYMIVVPIPKDGNFTSGKSVVEEFFRLTIGQAWNEGRSIQLMDACLAVSSLGNVIVTTFTAARVKQEIAKEGILPFSLVFAKNVNIIEWAIKKFKRSEQVAEPVETEGNTPERAKIEPIPFPALVLHCVFSTILILASICVPQSKDAYPLLVSIYTYPIDAMVAISLSLGIIWMRSTRSSGWNTYSTSNRWFSLATAIVVFVANVFPVVALWIPEALGSSVPWYIVPTIGCSLLLGGVVYCLIFRFAVPLFLGGAVLEVIRDPVIGIDGEGNSVQLGEMVYHKWSVPEDADLPYHNGHDAEIEPRSSIDMSIVDIATIHVGNRKGYFDANLATLANSDYSTYIVDFTFASYGVDVPASIEVLMSKKADSSVSDLTTVVLAGLKLLKNDHDTSSAAMVAKLATYVIPMANWMIAMIEDALPSGID
ncbi:hypothetical protein SBOR_9834 [Sclerotinia borealis F-4128]|uniref:High-affinity methionine permease n=1 Tax=Sclerotinia borealis (strain F-4128) TaxID=1432307 RepID=W9C241_SCLBF|nr:hypothetical protein SBOR_9834 [Sclerotinia borealis F-4128]